MRFELKRLVDAVGTGLGWAVGWAACGVLAGFAAVALPGAAQPGEFAALALAGLAAGLTFGALAAPGPDRRPPDLPHAVACGALCGLLPGGLVMAAGAGATGPDHGPQAFAALLALALLGAGSAAASWCAVRSGSSLRRRQHSQGARAAGACSAPVDGDPPDIRAGARPCIR